MGRFAGFCTGLRLMAAVTLLLAVATLTSACGQRGPVLPPEDRVEDAVRY